MSRSYNAFWRCTETGARPSSCRRLSKYSTLFWRSSPPCTPLLTKASSMVLVRSECASMRMKGL
jgi:hypothetical protein